VDQVAPRLSFFFAIGMDFFAEARPAQGKGLLGNGTAGLTAAAAAAAAAAALRHPGARFFHV
jgi:hypothetical protein